MYETQRLILRNWRDEDIEPYVKMNADSDVMEFFESPFTRERSLFSLERMKACAAEHGYTFWAVEQKSDGAFVGCIGIFWSDHFESPFTPGVEIGWRLDKPYWGKGYATEGAAESLRIGFEKYNLAEICAITVPMNVRSRRVMEKLGMSHNPAENFGHPKVPADHRYHEHVLYRLKREDWMRSR